MRVESKSAYTFLHSEPAAETTSNLIHLYFNITDNLVIMHGYILRSLLLGEFEDLIREYFFNGNTNLEISGIWQLRHEIKLRYFY